MSAIDKKDSWGRRGIISSYKWWFIPALASLMCGGVFLTNGGYEDVAEWLFGQDN